MTLVCVLAFGQSQSGQPETRSQDKPFRGGLDQVQNPDRPRPVRNNVAQPGEEVVTLRYFIRVVVAFISQKPYTHG
jgi:hypothetical protein